MEQEDVNKPTPQPMDSSPTASTDRELCWGAPFGLPTISSPFAHPATTIAVPTKATIKPPAVTAAAPAIVKRKT